MSSMEYYARLLTNDSRIEAFLQNFENLSLNLGNNRFARVSFN